MPTTVNHNYQPPSLVAIPLFGGVVSIDVVNSSGTSQGTTTADKFGNWRQSFSLAGDTYTVKFTGSFYPIGTGRTSVHVRPITAQNVIIVVPVDIPEDLRGEQGIQGPTGEKGDIGDTGPQGETGLQGDQGTGVQGDVGDMGPQGEKGDQGEVGPEGPTSSDGSPTGIASIWTFRNIASAPPLNEEVRFNSTTLSSVTFIYISDINADSVDVDTLLDSWAGDTPGGFITVSHASNSRIIWGWYLEGEYTETEFSTEIDSDG